MKSVKLDNFKIKEFFLMFLVVLLAGFGGGLIFFSRFEYRLLGVGFLLISFGLEYFLLTKIDTRLDVKKSKKEIEELLNKAKEIKNEIEKTAKELKEMKRKVFGWHEPLFTIKSLSEDISELKKYVGINYSWSGSSSMKKKIDKLEHEVKEIKRSFNMR